MLRRILIVAGILCVGGVGLAQSAPDGVDTPGYWLGKAQGDAGGISNPIERAGVLTTIADQWAGLGNAQAAAQAATDANAAAGFIADPQAKVAAYLALAGYHDQVQDGKTAATMALADAVLKSIPPGPGHDGAAEAWARTKAMAEGLNSARKPIDALTDPGDRATALADLAAGFAAAGPGHRLDYQNAISAAVTAAEQAKDAVTVNMLKAMIAQTMAQAGDLDGAAATADGLTDPAAQGVAQAALAAAYAAAGQADKAKGAIDKMIAAANASPDDRRAAIWLHVAHARADLGDKPGASAALDSSIQSANRLQSADQADALAAAATLRADLGDTPGGVLLATDAAYAARNVTDPQDAAEVNMSVATAQARCGLGRAAQQSIAVAEAAAGKIPQDKRHPGGDPPPQAYLDVISAAASASDFATAQAIEASVADPHLKHDATLAIAAAEVKLNEYKAAEDAAAREGSPDSEAAVCGIIAGSLATTRNANDAGRWIARLPNVSDKVAAELSVAGVEMGKMKK